MAKKHLSKNPDKRNPLFRNLFRCTNMFVLSFLLASGSIHAGVLSEQENKVSLEKSNVCLEQIIHEIESQSGYLFIYSGDVDIKREYSLNVRQQGIRETLQELFGNSGIKYRIDGSYIVLSKDKQEAAKQSVTQASRRISGKVVDAEGQPVIGANVVEKGTSHGVITDIDGRFSLEIPEKAVLQISYIGYVTQEIPVRNRKDFSIVLEDDTKLLDEVVVIGYGSVSKKELTSAISHVSAKDMLQIGNSNPAMKIQGKVAGVNIDNTASADPNSSANVQIRGVSSRSAGLGPLIVIDGVPGGSLDNVNENDIESIDVLKDGAASAIYGTRGSNGVIVITTKKGSTDGNIHTFYSGFVNVATPIRELEVLGGDEFRKYNRGNDYGANTDWFDEITKVGISHSHTLQVTGGNSKNNYKGTVDVKNSEGIDLRSSKKEIGARLSLNHTSKSELYNIVLNVAPRTIDYEHSDYNAFWTALTVNPTIPVMDPKEPNKYYKLTGWDTYNPVETLKLEEHGGKGKILNWDGTFKLNLLPLLCQNKAHYLSTQVTLAQQIIDYDNFFFRPSTSTRAEQKGFKGEASKSYDKHKQESLEWLVNYMFDKNNHHLKLMGGYSYQYFENSGFNAENKNFASDLLSYNNLGAGSYNSAAIGRLGMGSYKNDAKLIAFFGRISYNLSDKYFATFSLRREGSSKFGKNNKWGSFPAVSAGWRISEEKFMKNLTWIDDLKIRGDYGVTGNQEFDSYQSLATMGSYDLNFYKGQYIRGWSFNSNPNPDIKWEKGKNWNIGVDFVLFNQRLTGSMNYYSRRQSDLLGSYNVSLPPNGTPTTFVNVGTMKNSGLEIDLTWNAVKTQKTGYTIGFVGATSNNRFVSFSNQMHKGQSFYWMSSFPTYPGDPGPVQRIEEGERIGNFYTFEYAGVNNEGQWLIRSKNGDVIPINKGTDEDKRVVGNGLPKFTMSMTHSFRYKNFDMSLFFRGNFGFQIYDTHNLYYGLQSAAPNTNVLKSAYKENSAVSTGKNVHSDYFVHNGDFLKLDVATLGYNYDVNSKWLKKVRVYCTARNLFTISGYKGLDMDTFAVNGMEPGVSANKISYYPSSRQFLLGVQIDF